MAFQEHTPEEAVNMGPKPFMFVTPEPRTFTADDLTGICEALIDGYGELPEIDADGYDAHLHARYSQIVATANFLQAGLLAAAQEAGTADDLSEDELTALLHPKDAETLVFDEWDLDIPLILLATNYLPYTDIIPPGGEEIVFVDPHDERKFVESMERMGVGELWINEAEIERVQEQRLAASAE